MGHVVRWIPFFQQRWYRLDSGGSRRRRRSTARGSRGREAAAARVSGSGTDEEESWGAEMELELELGGEGAGDWVGGAEQESGSGSVTGWAGEEDEAAEKKRSGGLSSLGRADFLWPARHAASLARCIIRLANYVWFSFL